MKWFALAAVGVLSVWGSGWILLWIFLGDLPARGQFGDMFGAINALFLGLAFAGVIIAVLFQRTELQLQREELALTRQELARSARAQEQLVRSQERAALLNARAALMTHFGTGLLGAGSSSERDHYKTALINSVKELEERESV